MNYLLIKHTVKDFDTWKTFFDGHSGVRHSAGLKEEKLFRNANNDHEVVILFKVEDENKAKAFGESNELRELMQKAGVVSKPEFIFLRN